MKKGIFLIIFLSIIGALILTFAKPQEKTGEADKPSEVIRDVQLQLSSESALVPLEKLGSGCEEKDCIKSIDHPQFESVDEANGWLGDNDRVFVLSQNGESKIYPEKIISWHEVVNDEIASEPVAVTFGPPSGSAIAFVRKVDEITTTFGVSGKLFNSNLILYDRYEGSLWQQFTGQGITGPAAKRSETLAQLKLLPLSWMKAREDFPESKVLSLDTGFDIDYTKKLSDSYFEVTSLDNRLHPKAWVYGIVVNGMAKAYPELKLAPSGEFNDVVGDTAINVINDNGILTFRKAESGEEIPALKSFWFAWAAFHPNTLL
ncbi:MAG: hypothetical protein COU65_01345 [Candidatus Pacebacteria bacterium CG10_big_fil_rev_8_21_14_0_10_42_12]|nr:DUF3179 domain-containing protein [Candidatus Paceibacterota bacterium]PIR62849.1 MAG: hypothetical protein COU65_01345 [Candidatus Pacebacteria bacterium CG10_big_fil_rev_8_21_14_0_10_42_12]